MSTQAFSLTAYKATLQISWALRLQEESEELRALQSHIAAAETRLGQRLQLQERSAAAATARLDSIALDRALHEQRADVRILAPNHCHWMSCTSTDRALLLPSVSVLVRAVVDSDETYIRLCTPLQRSAPSPAPCVACPGGSKVVGQGIAVQEARSHP